MHFTFQQSRIWEGGSNQIDPNGKTKRIKNKNEERARKKLPRPELGRKWLLIKSEG